MNKNEKFHLDSPESKATMQSLSDDELDTVAGGRGGYLVCPTCGKRCPEGSWAQIAEHNDSCSYKL